MPSNDITLRRGAPADAMAAGTIAHDAFAAIAAAHGFPRDFPSPAVATGLLEQLLARDDVHAVVAERSGRVVGSNFLWEGDAVAGIGPITVEPGEQNAAVGRRLMEQVIARARRRGVASVRLVQAAYHNRSMSLYAKLGFVAREPLSVLQGPALGGLTIAGRVVRAARVEDLLAANALAALVHGHDRAGELRAAVAAGSARVVEHDGRITGYATDIAFFGHAVAQHNDDLKALIAAAPAFAGPGFLLPTRNGELLRWCLESGLRIVMPMTLMSLGVYREPQGAWLPSILY